jgi:hypothetical protein
MGLSTGFSAQSFGKGSGVSSGGSSSKNLGDWVKDLFGGGSALDWTRLAMDFYNALQNRDPKIKFQDVPLTKPQQQIFDLALQYSTPGGNAPTRNTLYPIIGDILEGYSNLGWTSPATITGAGLPASLAGQTGYAGYQNSVDFSGIRNAGKKPAEEEDRSGGGGGGNAPHRPGDGRPGSGGPAPDLRIGESRPGQPGRFPNYNAPWQSQLPKGRSLADLLGGPQQAQSNWDKFWSFVKDNKIDAAKSVLGALTGGAVGAVGPWLDNLFKWIVGNTTPGDFRIFENKWRDVAPTFGLPGDRFNDWGQGQNRPGQPNMGFDPNAPRNPWEGMGAFNPYAIFGDPFTTSGSGSAF